MSLEHNRAGNKEGDMDKSLCDILPDGGRGGIGRKLLTDYSYVYKEKLTACSEDFLIPQLTIIRDILFLICVICMTSATSVLYFFSR